MMSGHVVETIYRAVTNFTHINGGTRIHDKCKVSLIPEHARIFLFPM